jgi:hypothetical protein
MADDEDYNWESELESLVDDALEGAETDEEDRVVRVTSTGSNTSSKMSTTFVMRSSKKFATRSS